MDRGTVQTVAILITDLVGSTQLAFQLGPVAAEELREEHFGLLREVVSETGGREIKNTGDGLMVAFASAAAAVTCAVSVQQRFDQRNRFASEPLLIKAGLSVGDASTAEGDVFGMPVIEAARLCDQCSGGQILAKEIVAHLASGRGHVFSPTAALELKGFEEPLSTVELRWEPALSGGIALPERLRELPATAYVGRVSERERLTELWGEACAGSLRIALISGEAGVGKTRLSTHLAHSVHSDGANVLYGRCDEDLGVPYQPWVQALGHLVDEAPKPLLESHVEKHGGDLARLIPALAERVGDLPAARESDPETERYLLYAAAGGLLERAAEREPLFLILDDLQWADAPTLSLLRHVAVTGGPMRLMLVCTYRDSDLSRDHPLTGLLADLHREQGIERVKLTGLDAQDVMTLMEAAAGHDLDESGRALATEVTRETAGNPFFAGELLRHLTETGAIVQADGGQWRLAGTLAELGLPQSVREVIGRRVERLGPAARTTLSAAAVIGRDFDLDLLMRVLGGSQDELLDLLEVGVEASLLIESAGQPGRFTFTHALVVHTLYEDLGATRRAWLHRQVAEALEQQCGSDPGERLGELANHWAAAVVSTDIAKAKDYARRAAVRALKQLAPAEAMRWYRQALELHDQTPGDDPAERCDLLIGLGQAERQNGAPAFRQTLLDAAALAQDLGDADRLCRAALANSRGWESQVGAVDTDRVKVQEAAASLLPRDDPKRGQVLALLAAELHWSRETERCRRLAEEAIAIARTAGDPAILAETLVNASWAIWVPDTLNIRIGLIDELVEISDRLDDPWLSFWVAARSIMIGEEAADRSQVELHLATMRALAEEVPQPAIAFARHLIEFCWALVQGDLDGAEQWAIQGFQIAEASGQPDAAVMVGAQLFQVRYFQGRVGELVEQIAGLAAQPDSLAAWRVAAALALIESDRGEEARELALAEDMRSAPIDQAWCVTMFWWADVCSRLGLTDQAAVLCELLGPFSGQLAASGAVFLGSVDWALGSLAATLGDHDRAAGHFAAAAEIEGRLGARLCLGRTHAGWAGALIARGRREDVESAEDLLRRAEDTASALNAGAIAGATASHRSRLAAISH